MKINRKLRNIIMIVFIFLLCSSICFTMYYVKNNVKNNESNINKTSSNTPPDMSDSNMSMQEPPEKPEGDIEGSTPPEMPSGGLKDFNEQSANSSTTFSTTYYIIFGVEGLILSSLIIYLIMSKFNKKTIKETFEESDKVIIYILCLIILTSGITYGSVYITKNLLINNKTASNNSSDENNTSSNIEYSSPTTIKESTTLSDESFKSTLSDENAVLVTGERASTLTNINVSKSGDSDGGDNTSFYGTNSAILAKDKAVLTLKNITVNTDATGANGVFCYGGSATTNNSSSDNTTINISDSTITTSKDNSGGIMTTGGGIMNATNLIIDTAGTSSAAIRTDRGGGTVTVNKGTYTTSGKGSPAIYSTANVIVKDAKLISNKSEGIVVEGKNSVELDNVELIDTNNELNGQSTTYKNVFLYQSMSGDASNGNATFTSSNSTITTNKGDSFYITNTTAIINLENNSIVNNDSEGNFLRAQKDSWGTSGSNGGVVTLNMTNQKVTGNIILDSISTLTMNLLTDSYYEGTINKDNTAKTISLTLDKTSKIKLTGNSYITSLSDKDTDYSNIDFNGYKLYVNGTSIN